MLTSSGSTTMLFQVYSSIRFVAPEYSPEATAKSSFSNM
jgi:hypothetical protein